MKHSNTYEKISNKEAEKIAFGKNPKLNERQELPWWQKYTLTLEEAAEQMCIRDSQWTQRKTTFPALIRDIKKSVKNFDDMCVPDKLKKLKDYEQVKENLFIRLINFEKNKTELEKAFYKRNGDIALTLYMKIFDEDGMLTSLKVPLQCVKRWDLENEDVFMAALKNTASMMPPKAVSYTHLAGDYSAPL